jgi:hypothetical protein
MLIHVFRGLFPPMRGIAIRYLLCWNPMDINSYYWFYSTLTQAMGALLGLFGVFMVFVSEAVIRALEAERLRMNELLRLFGKRAFIPDIEYTLKMAEEIHKKPPKNISDEWIVALGLHIGNVERIRTRESEITFSFVILLFNFLFLIFGSLAMTSLCDPVRAWSAATGFAIWVFFLLWSGTVLFLMLRYVIYCVAADFEMSWVWKLLLQKRKWMPGIRKR